MSEKNKYDQIEQKIKNLEEELRKCQEGEEKLRSETEFTEIILDSQLDTFFLFEVATGEAIRWNRAFNDITGYTDEEIAVLPAPDSYYSPDDLKRTSVFIREVLEKGIGTIELDLICKDGRKVPTEYKVSLVRDDAGKPKYFISVGRDITDRKGAEEALKRERDRSQQYLDIAGVVFVAIDTEQNVTMINKKGCEILGYEEHEILGRNWFEHFIRAGNIEEIKGVFNRILNDEMEPMEYYENSVITKNNDERIIAWHNSIIRNESGRIVGTLSSGEDITERKRAQKALEENEQRLKTVFQSSPDYLMMLDKRHRIQIINRVEPGLDIEKVIGTPLYQLAPPDSRASIKSNLDRVIQNAERLQYDGVHRRPDGSKVHFSSIVSPIIVANQVTGSVVSSRDVSDQTRLRDEKNKLEKQYRQAQKVEAIGRLAGGVAHDLNNLLIPILGYGELLRDDFSPGDKRRESMEQMVYAGYKARDLVRQLLAFSRKQTLEYKTVNLNKTLGGIEKLLRRTIREDITMKMVTSPDIPPVLADIGQIEQVIMNLVVNTEDAMQKGGLVTIRTAIAELTGGDGYAVTSQAVKPGKYVVLSVTDTGCGMDKETLEHMYEPFYSTKGEQGTGLGLATVYGIVKQHEGDIRVQSEPDKGTTFNVYLPVSEKAQAEDKADERISSSPRGSETILLVEDNEQVRKVCQAILKQQGYTILLAKDGHEALKVLEEHHAQICLLLTDVVMPEMNGRELFARAVEKNRNLKVLFMSGYTDDIIAPHQVLENGVQFIQKPFSVKALSVKVRDVLDSANV